MTVIRHSFGFIILVLSSETSSAFSGLSVHSRIASETAFSLESALHESRSFRRLQPLYAFYADDDEEEEEDEEEDDEIDLDSLGDWRDFRRSLSMEQKESFDEEGGDSTPKSVSKENEQLLRTQSEALAEEYINGVWAHETSTVSLQPQKSLKMKGKCGMQHYLTRRYHCTAGRSWWSRCANALGSGTFS